MTTIQKKMFEEIHDQKIYEDAVKYGCDYLEKAFGRNVYPEENSLMELKEFDEPVPVKSSSAKLITDKLHKFGSPATITQAGGRYFGFVCGSVVPAGLAAKILATFWDQNTAMYVLSPLAAKLEMIVEKWLRDIFKLSDDAVAGFVSGTSSANLCALAAARYRLLKNQGWDVNQKGFRNSPPVKIIAGKEAHSTILRAIGLLGFGMESVSFIETDEQGRIRTGQIPEPDDKTLLILQAGNVNGGSFDNFSEICQKAKQAGAWVHIDGAFGLWARATKEFSYLTNGIEHANSFAVDAHKTLNTPYDSGIVMCTDKDALTNALQMSAGYIVLSDDRDGMFYTPEMSRRSRIVELWATIKFLGTEGIDEMIYGMHLRAKQFADELSGIKGFTILNEIVFNQVVAACDTDEITSKVIDNVQKDRVCWVGGSTWQGRKVIRISVCSWATTEKDVSISVESMKRSLDKALMQ